MSEKLTAKQLGSAIVGRIIAVQTDNTRLRELLAEWELEQRKHRHCLHCGHWDSYDPGDVESVHRVDCLVLRTRAVLSEEQYCEVVGALSAENAQLHTTGRYALRGCEEEATA